MLVHIPLDGVQSCMFQEVHHKQVPMEVQDQEVQDEEQGSLMAFC